MALVVPQLAIDAVLSQQLSVAAALDGAASGNDDDFVHLDHRGQTVGRPDHGAALGDLQQRAVDRGLRGLVERRGRLVEQQHRGVADDGAGDGDALALAAGQRVAALADDGVVSLRQAHDVAMDLGLLGRLLHLGIGSAFLAEADVLPQRHVEQHIVLEHDRHAAAQRIARDLADVDAIDGDAALIGHVEPQDQVQQRALAGA